MMKLNIIGLIYFLNEKKQINKPIPNKLRLIDPKKQAIFLA